VSAAPDYRKIFSEGTGGQEANYQQMFGEYAGSLAAGAALLTEVEQFICSYIVLPKAARLPFSAWIFATHCFDLFDVFPYMAVTSPVPACGKSKLLELAGMLSANALPASNISEAALFRTISDERPTLFLDEAEWLREKSERAQIIRNILNAGHRANSVVIRCEKSGERNTFNVFCPKAIACIGSLTDTLESRSIHIAMQKRATNEKIRRFRYANIRKEAEPLRERIAAFVTASRKAIGGAYASLPDLPFLDDRAADNWSPLFAVVNLIDPLRGRDLKQDAMTLCASRADMVDDCLPLRLLSDFATVARTRQEDVIATSILIMGAMQIEEAPWGREVDLTPRKVAKWLRGFSIWPTRKESYRGYERGTILAAARRYNAEEGSEASGSVIPNSFNDLEMTNADASDGCSTGQSRRNK
jgi:hypothetical protein